MPLENLQHEILNVLLKRLMEQELIAKAAYDKALNMVHSTIDFPAFFEYPMCCRKEGETNGCTQD